MNIDDLRFHRKAIQQCRKRWFKKGYLLGIEDGLQLFPEPRGPNHKCVKTIVGGK